MKRVIPIVIIIAVMLINYNSYIIPSESIRFRIVPNSNKYEDVVMKNMVAYDINSIISNMNDSSIIDARKTTNSKKNLISKSIDRLFEEYNYNMNYEIDYGLNYFPTKYYDGVEYSEGYYESLVINIGEAKGDNFWCVLYPSLCLVEDEKRDVKYNFKILELIDKLF